MRSRKRRRRRRRRRRGGGIGWSRRRGRGGFGEWFRGGEVGEIDGRLGGVDHPVLGAVEVGGRDAGIGRHARRGRAAVGGTAAHGRFT